MMRRTVSRLGVLGLAALGSIALTGCGTTVQETFGLSKRAPDEFSVVRRAPLAMPPNLNQLPLPQPGSPRPQDQATSRQAREVLTGSTGSRPSVESGGEAALLAAMPVVADPDIRAELLAENTQLAEVDDRTYLFILNWQRQRIAEQRLGNEVLDPVAESQRLQGEGPVSTVRVGSTPLNLGSGT